MPVWTEMVIPPAVKNWRIIGDVEALEVKCQAQLKVKLLENQLFWSKYRFKLGKEGLPNAEEFQILKKEVGIQIHNLS